MKYQQEMPTLNSLVAERLRWSIEYKGGAKPTFAPYQDYKENRLSEQWRASAAIEKFCEYVLYLERELLRVDKFDEAEWDRERIQSEDNLIDAAGKLFALMGCASFSAPICNGTRVLKVSTEEVISEATN